MCPDIAPATQLSTAEVAALTRQRLGELDRLRKMGMTRMEMLDASLDLVPRERQWEVLLGRNGQVAQFDRICRAIRQIIVLECELEGLFSGPDRSGLGLAIPLEGVTENDLDDLRDPKARERGGLSDRENLRDRSDYRRGPLDEVVAGIRKILGAEPPENDPFAPPLGRKPAQAAFPAKPSSTGLPPGAKPRRPAMQLKPAAKASPVKPAIPRKGFRLPPTSPHNPGTPADVRKGRRNRGPPG